MTKQLTKKKINDSRVDQQFPVSPPIQNIDPGMDRLLFVEEIHIRTCVQHVVYHSVCGDNVKGGNREKKIAGKRATTKTVECIFCHEDS